MGLTYDHAGLAAVIMTRIAAEEAEEPGHPTGRMTDFVAGLVDRNGPDAATDLLSPWHGNTSPSWTQPPKPSISL